MGLDCFLSAVHPTGPCFRFKNPTPGHANTWRKYHTLHDYVDSLWTAAGRPGAEVRDASDKTDVKKNSDGSYTIFMDPGNDGTAFNTIKFQVTSAQLETFFRREDPAFDTPNNVDYANLTDDDNELSEAEFYRNWNRSVLKIAKGFEERGWSLVYFSWY